MILEVNQENFSQEVEAARGLVLLDFWGPTCQPCRMLSPFVEKLPELYGNKVKVGKVDASKNAQVCIDLKIFGLPTFVMFQDGKELGRISGKEVTPAAISDFIDKYLTNTMKNDLLAGGIDLHTHSAPSVANRALDDFELALEAKEAGMKGVVIKAHECPTAGRAALVSKRMEGISVFGGVVLNNAVGGFNPAAADMALRMGGKIVWFPTTDAQNHLLKFRDPVTGASHADPSAVGLTILDENGRLKPEIEPILNVIAKRNGILATGHLSAQEVLVLTDAAVEAGVKKILITHADMDFIGLSLDEQVYLANKGAIIEKCYVTFLWKPVTVTPQSMVESIKVIGADRCVLVTDLGQATNVHPAEGMRIFVNMLLAEGITEQEIRIMLVENPARLLEV